MDLEWYRKASFPFAGSKYPCEWSKGLFLNPPPPPPRLKAPRVQDSTVGSRRTVCRRTIRLEFYLKIRTTPGWKNESRTVHTCHMTVSMSRTNQKPENWVWITGVTVLVACMNYNPDLGRGIVGDSRPGTFGPRAKRTWSGIADNAPPEVWIVYFHHMQKTFAMKSTSSTA